MAEPLLTQHSCYASFNTPYSRQSDSYKTYDSTTGKVLNCFYPQKGPMEIALTGTYTKTTNINLTQFQDSAKGGCNLTNFPKATYPEIYESFDKEFEIFQKLYINNLSGSLNSGDLVPTITGNIVSCSGTGYIPYVLEYELDKDYIRYARFCATQTQINQLQFTTIGDYTVFDYLDVNTSLPCQSSSCTTAYPAFVCHNLNPDPVMSSKPEDQKNQTTLIIVGVIAGLLLFAAIGFMLLYLRERKYRLNKNINLNKQTKNK